MVLHIISCKTPSNITKFIQDRFPNIPFMMNAQAASPFGNRIKCLVGAAEDQNVNEICKR